MRVVSLSALLVSLDSNPDAVAVTRFVTEPGAVPWTEIVTVADA